MRRRAFIAGPLAGLSGCAVQTAALQAARPGGLPPRIELVATPFFAQTEYHCGPAALATALGAIGIEVSPQALAAEVFLPARTGSLQVEMLAGARRHGGVATRLPGTLEALLRELAAGTPVVVLLNLSLPIAPLWHYAVVVGYDLDSSQFVMRSGGTPRDRLSLRTFEHTWSRSGHWAFVVMPPGRWPVTAEVEAVVEAAVGFERSASPRQALQVYDSASSRWPASLPLAIGLGTSLHATGDTARAAEVFRTAAERHRSGAAWLNVAQLMRSQGRHDEAESAARRALADPRWAARAQAFLAQPTSLP